ATSARAVSSSLLTGASLRRCVRSNITQTTRAIDSSLRRHYVAGKTWEQTSGRSVGVMSSRFSDGGPAAPTRARDERSLVCPGTRGEEAFPNGRPGLFL